MRLLRCVCSVVYAFTTPPTCSSRSSAPARFSAFDSSDSERRAAAARSSLSAIDSALPSISTRRPSSPNTRHSAHRDDSADDSDEAAATPPAAAPEMGGGGVGGSGGGCGAVTAAVEGAEAPPATVLEGAGEGRLRLGEGSCGGCERATRRRGLLDGASGGEAGGGGEGLGERAEEEEGEEMEEDGSGDRAEDDIAEWGEIWRSPRGRGGRLSQTAQVASAEQCPQPDERGRGRSPAGEQRHGADVIRAQERHQATHTATQQSSSRGGRVQQREGAKSSGCEWE